MASREYKLSHAAHAQRRSAAEKRGAEIAANATRWRALRVPERVALALERERADPGEALWKVIERRISSC